MIRFRFELYPLDEVSPWGGDRPTLHWFGLTDGWYWLEAGGQELLRRPRQVRRHPFVDYHLARLWEDVNVLTPTVLEPVPEDCAGLPNAPFSAWPLHLTLPNRSR
ncbi:hypothetical protein GCM10028790_06600 [Micromonospora taraxaci]|uniref:Uncharacterized protein n=1 Tax=Micromonospora taraxaci TaxID=1316803 RepID=A0A561W782_9ACTN|nr:DUF5984 family protein [Micromonospora taraxaci]TWG19710.1 hypothetical protein FHU34_115096 [Micromonospora taraxaci]